MLKGMVAGGGGGNGGGPAAGAEEESERARLTTRAAQPLATEEKEKKEVDGCGLALPPSHPPSHPPSLPPSLDSRSRSSRSAEQTNPTRTKQAVRSESATSPASPASAAGSSKTQTKALASPSFYTFMALPEVLQVGKLVPIAEEEDADDEEEHAHAHADEAFGQEKHALADAALVDAADAVLVAQRLCCSKHEEIERDASCIAKITSLEEVYSARIRFDTPSHASFSERDDCAVVSGFLSEDGTVGCHTTAFDTDATLSSSSSLVFCLSDSRLCFCLSPYGIWR